MRDEEVTEREVQILSTRTLNGLSRNIGDLRELHRCIKRIGILKTETGILDKRKTELIGKGKVSLLNQLRRIKISLNGEEKSFYLKL